MIDVDHHQRQVAVMSMLPQQLVEGAPVGEAGEAVGGGEGSELAIDLPQLLFQLLAPGHIAHSGDAWANSSNVCSTKARSSAWTSSTQRLPSRLASLQPSTRSAAGEAYLND